MLGIVSNCFAVFFIVSNRAGDEQKHQWISAIEKYQKITDSQAYILICELHFDPASITKRKNRNILAKGTIPTVFGDLQRYVPLEFAIGE